MTATLNPQQFVNKWRDVTLKERASSQEHFIDLCRLLGHPTPAEQDPTGSHFTFEKGADKQSGGQGWADVWYHGRFAWEYKGKHANLDKAYQQLLQYREALQNPPLLIVCDMARILIHTNFTNTVKQVFEITLDDLLQPEPLNRLRAAFYHPDQLKAPQTTQQVTEEAAREFARLAELLRKWGEDSGRIAHFLIRLLFCLFAEDIGLLPKALFSQLVARTRQRAPDFARQLQQLFEAMQHGGWFGVEEIVHFNGGLFDDATVLPLDSIGMDILARVSQLDWGSMEPSILGVLFERSLDPGKRAQLGAHYTSKEDILLIVEPVLMAPLRRRWAEVKSKALELDGLIRELEGQAFNQDARARRTRSQKQLRDLLTGFAAELAQVRVLDPACGSGNFLYVALRQLLDLEKEVIMLAGDVGIGRFYPNVSPAQLYGIEMNEYAHELAQTTVWIGYIQWLHENGFGHPGQPILKPLHNIWRMDAILGYDEKGKPIEPTWPEADVIVGNPPFLGSYKLRQELGNKYVEALFRLYNKRIPGAADLVTYWFERARDLIKSGMVKRSGLLATNSIRGGANRRVLERVKETGDIFMSWSDRPWILDGAAVHVSMVGFDDGSEQERYLDGEMVSKINSDLTSNTDLSKAKQLKENLGLVYKGMMKGGPFDIDNMLANKMLNAPLNPNQRPNTDVVKRRIGGQDIVKRPSNTWVIDFGVMTEDEASLYEIPFEYVHKNVKPIREQNRRESRQKYWWRFGEPNPTLRAALKPIKRCIGTTETAKHRVFAWLEKDIVPDYSVHVIVRDDDYFFGVLQSKVHILWASRKGTSLEDRPRYTSSTTLETFPFPWPPGQEPTEDARVQAIAAAARDLVQKRDAWLNPPGLSEKELSQRTLTNLYNQRPTWLALAHHKLDEAVLAAYGWPPDLSDEQILEHLLALNLARAGA